MIRITEGPPFCTCLPLRSPVVDTCGWSDDWCEETTGQMKNALNKPASGCLGWLDEALFSWLG